MESFSVCRKLHAEISCEKRLSLAESHVMPTKVTGAELAPLWHKLWKKCVDKSWECKLKGEIKL